MGGEVSIQERNTLVPFQTEWHPEPTIYLTRFSGVIIEADMEAWAAELTTLMNGRDELLYMIFDLSAHEKFAVNVMTMPNVASMFRHPKLGWSGIIGITPLVSMWMELLGRTTNVRFKLFPSVDDATDFLLTYIRIESERSRGADSAAT